MAFSINENYISHLKSRCDKGLDVGLRNEDLRHLLDCYEFQKQRADLLQDDLNSVDILHYDECANLRATIAFLRQQLKIKEVN